MTRHWIHPVTAPCNVTGSFGMTCHWIRPNFRHIGILHLVSISTISPQSTHHSAPFCEILSKPDHPRQKKMTSCRFSRWRISAILDFRGAITGSLKSPRTISYRSSIDTIDLIFLHEAALTVASGGVINNEISSARHLPTFFNLRPTVIAMMTMMIN